MENNQNENYELYKKTEICNWNPRRWECRLPKLLALWKDQLKNSTKCCNNSDNNNNNNVVTGGDNEKSVYENSKWQLALQTMLWQRQRQRQRQRRRNSRFNRRMSRPNGGDCSNYNKSSKKSKFNKNNHLLITIILLLITSTIVTIYEFFDTTTTMTTTATATATLTATALMATTTKIAALKVLSGNPAFLVIATSATIASAASLSAQQQQQQRQLFAMLTKNGQQSSSVGGGGGGGGGIAGTASSSMARRTLEEGAVHDDNTGGGVSLETFGFVSDDGDQRYEKAEKALAAAAAAAAAKGNDASNMGNRSKSNNNNNNNYLNNNNNNSNVNCPKECKCLNDFFDCGKKHLDRVPTLPGYVQTLDLAGNKLNDTTVLQIRNLEELRKLSLKRNQLDVMPKFIGLTSLRQLNLASNRIQRISSEALSALPKLRVLNLTKNYIHTLEPNYFPKENRLVHLTLNANEIASIDEGAFEHLNTLTDLELNSNHLATLPAGVFKNLNRLKKLSLNNNNLEINWSTFRGLESIQKLALQSNNIRALQDGVFHVMHKIESIELDHNGITSLSRQGLFNLTKLHNLSLSNNTISRIELDTWEFTQSLITLDLSNNNISEFKPQHLDCLQHLRQLNLGHNKIQFFADNTFECVKNLEDLNLKRNRLAWIIEDAGAMPPFKSLRKLKKLDLSGNNLKQINSKSLSGLISLEQLNLDGNALASIQKGAFEYMTHLQKLKFKSMNFICDCEILWFRRWLLAKSHVTSQMQKNAICGYPDHLLDRELLSLTPAELICADSPKPIIIQEPTNQLAVKGANITMECIASSPAAASFAAADELKIKWRHDNQNLRERFGNTGTSTPPGPTQLHHNSHHHHQHHQQHHHQQQQQQNAASNSYSNTDTQIHHDQTSNQTTIMGYLRLYNVSYESAGRYQCVVSNAFGTTYSQKFKLSIGIHPRFLQIPSNLTIDSGDTARLVCSATGDPMPEIALQKFGASDFPAATERRLQVIREENAFVITNAKPIDTGIYTCTAESAAGEIKINASLVVNDKPQPSIPLAHKEVLLGSSSVLECLSDVAAELQRPHREWFKDNKPFHTSTTSASERFYFTTEKELLVIVNTQSMDVGLYRCEITDDSKTYSLQTALIVVKEDINQNILIIASAIVACILVILLIVGAMLCYQRRKMYLNGGQSSCGGGGGGGTRIIFDSSHRTLNGSRASALDQTQLTTLNRTYLRPQYEHRSMADVVDMNGGSISHRESQADAEQRNCLIVSTTPSYHHNQHQQQQQQQEQDQQQRVQYDNTIDAYLRRNSLYDAEHQQDHLSSKDSGTGSDAAVKRSLDDFTIALLPPNTPNGAHIRIHRAVEIENTPSDDDNNGGYDVTNSADADADARGATDSDPDIATSPVLGLSEIVELREFNRSNNGSSITTSPFTTTTNRINTIRPTISNSFDLSMSANDDDVVVVVGIPSVNSNAKCKQEERSTSFNANATPQAVDI